MYVIGSVGLLLVDTFILIHGVSNILRRRLVDEQIHGPRYGP